jgi:hypothetical protein
MAAAATNGNGKTKRAGRDEVTDRRVLVLMLEMRDQGYSFSDIAAALMKQGLITLSPDRVRDMLEAHQVQPRTK